MRILYAGDSPIGGAANYLLAILKAMRATAVHVPPTMRLTGRHVAHPCDAFIFSDFSSEHAPAKWQRLIARHVEQGSGLLMIGGWASFSGPLGQWRGTQIASLLPVRCVEGDDRVPLPSGAWIVREAAHPMFQELSFHTPPMICGLNRVMLRPRARLLWSARPVGSADGHRASSPRPRAWPLLVIDGDPQRRIAALMTDIAPHWCGGLLDWGTRRVRLRVTSTITVEVGDHYVRFLSSLMHWLVNSRF